MVTNRSSKKERKINRGFQRPVKGRHGPLNDFSGPNNYLRPSINRRSLVFRR